MSIRPRIESLDPTVGTPMRSSILIMASLLAMISLSKTTTAESVAAVLKYYGVEGTWSLDCGSPMAARIKFEVPVLGPATVFYSDQSKTARGEIQSAAKVTEEKFELTIILLTMKRAGEGEKIVEGEEAKPDRSILTKRGAKIEWLSGYGLEKCLN